MGRSNDGNGLVAYLRHLDKLIKILEKVADSL